jgi:SAM-dependent methyltransferase
MNPGPNPASSTHYAVTLVCPPGYPHILALIEIAETLHYALQSLGYDSVVTDNLDEPGRRHILLGANLLPKFNMGSPKPDSIIYNFEQVDERSDWIDEAYLQLLRTHSVWDYSTRNIALLRQKGITDIHHLPLGYVPELERIHPAPIQDIDVLFYGSINERRQRVLDDLRARGLRVEQVFGLYGAERDALVARAKIVLNVHFYESKIFEVARVSYLLSNGTCVVSETGSDPAENEFAEGLAFAPYESLADTCIALADDPARRIQLREEGRRLMRARPQVGYLRELLAQPDNMTGTQTAASSAHSYLPLPVMLNMGSGKDWREDAFNVDIEAEWSPDVVFDFNTPLPADGVAFDTRRFGPIRLTENHFELIQSFDVLEHIQQLTTAMTTCLAWLKEGGIFRINVPYDLSWGAWQDPTHVRAFNEKSWLYYTDWFWYLGWDRWRFDMLELKYMLSPIGQALHEQGMPLDAITRTPRAVDSMLVELRKRHLNEAEIAFIQERRKKKAATGSPA